MFDTRNDLPANVRVEVTELLNARLADAIDLGAQSKYAHWNVKGPNFIALHELFDKVAESADEFVDLLAERTTSLGGTAEGTVQIAAQRSTLPPYPMQIAGWREHVEALSSALAAFGTSVREAIDQSAEFGDIDTSDLFTEISRATDKYLWFVEAHLHG
jgi:starvation-inducible DNA-binding protein